MDITTVAEFISLQVAGGFLKEHGKEIYTKVRALLTPDELISLDLLEKQPANRELQDKVATTLARHLEANSDVVQDLTLLLKQLSTFEEKEVTITQIGNSNLALQDIHGSTLNISKP